MNYNRNFGHLDPDTHALVYAADTALVDGVRYANPSAAMYARCNPPELPIDASAPSDPAPEGKHWEPRGWEVWDDDRSPTPPCIRRVWALVDDPPPPPRRWSRLTIETALADYLDEVDAFLASVTIKGKLTAARAFSRCDYIEEGFGGAETWNTLLDGAAAAIGKTRAEIDAFLDALPTE